MNIYHPNSVFCVSSPYYSPLLENQGSNVNVRSRVETVILKLNVFLRSIEEK